MGEGKMAFGFWALMHRVTVQGIFEQLCKGPLVFASWGLTMGWSAPEN
jgi:hypothetical protein